MMRSSLRVVCLLLGIAAALASTAAPAQEAKTNLFSLILVEADLLDATKLMTVYDPNEDGFVDKFEQQRLPWKDVVNEFDLNKDGKLTHMEVAVRQAKLRDDNDVTQSDINNVNTFVRRYDTNRNGQLDPDEIEAGGWPAEPSDYDQNGDGTLTVKEMAVRFALNRGLRREMGIESIDQTGAIQLVRRFDTDNDKKLNPDEQAKAPLPKPGKDFDEDEDGKLGIMELATMLAKHRRDAGLSKPDTFKIRKLFAMFDPNGDGKIDLKDPLTAAPLGGESANNQLEAYDGNKDGIVTIAEVEKIVAAVRKERGYAEEEFQKAKKMITRHDRNADKQIEESELFDKPIPGQLPKSLIKQADLDKDGKVNLDELSRYFSKQNQ